MDHPYKDLENSKLWSIVEKSLNDLMKNNDISIQTPKEYVIGYFCSEISKKL